MGREPSGSRRSVPEQFATVLLAVVIDLELTPEAARLVQYVIGLGGGEDGWHHVSYAKISALLGHGGDHRIKKAIASGESAGWLEADYLTGRLPPRFRVCPGKFLNQKAVSPGKFLDQKPTVVGDVVATPLYSPTEPFDPSLSLPAMDAMAKASEKLSGCRGALRDYLRARVPLDRQYGYVQSVVVWIDNPLATFRRPDGTAVPPDERTQLLAVALNEMSATDETKRKHAAGDPSNLKTKLGFVIRDRYGGGARSPASTSGGSAPRPGSRDAPPDSQVYRPTKKFQGFNG